MRWRPIPGTRGRYEASDSGLIRTTKPRYRTNVGGVLSQRADSPGGYRYVNIMGSRGSNNRTVHGLVAAAFLGPRPRGKQVNHINAQKGDNRPANLEYVSGQQNVRHALRFGLLPVGERHHNAKLTDAQVASIRREWVPRRHSATKLAAKFGVSPAYVEQILRREARVTA